MIRLDPQCAKKNCQFLPEHSLEGEPPRYCKYHKTKNMTYRPGCLTADCLGARVFGYPEGEKQFCTSHKLAGMVQDEEGEYEESEVATVSNKVQSEAVVRFEEEPQDFILDEEAVTSKDFVTLSSLEKCEADGCTKPSRFGFSNGPTRFCLFHKLEGMLFHSTPGNNSSKESKYVPCRFQDCPSTAVYGYDNEVIEFCKEHKHLGMEKFSAVKLANKCGEKECYKKSTYGFKYVPLSACHDHKKEGMYYRHSYKNKSVGYKYRPRCEGPGCTNFAEYGESGERARCCIIHKDLSMIFVSSSQTHRFSFSCQAEDCSRKALYCTTEGATPTLCASHKGEDSYRVSNNFVRHDCETEDCLNDAIFGYPGDKARRCVSHMLEGMETKVAKKKKKKTNTCFQNECTKKGLFGFAEMSETYCEEHKMDDMLLISIPNSTEQKCKGEGCSQPGYYGSNQSDSYFCEDHKTDDMLLKVLKKSKNFPITPLKLSAIICENQECARKATFGYPGGMLQVCSRHVVDGMEYLGVVRMEKLPCKEPECQKRAHFGFIGGSLEYCMSHKKKDMFFRCKQPERRYCAQEGCQGEPVFGLKRSRGIRYCNMHRTPEMMPADYMCKYPEGCSRKASYGYKEAPKLRCFKHRMGGMISKKPKSTMKYCRAEGCTTTPSYGTVLDPRIFCVRHKKDGMIHNGKRGTCEKVECNRHPYYGYPDGKTRFCSVHKLSGMIPRHGRKKCEYEGCPKQPTYGYQGKVRQFCNKHKLDGMTRDSVCRAPGCNKYPHYGLAGQSVREYCNAHKLEWMVYHPKPGVLGGAAVPQRKKALHDLQEGMDMNSKGDYNANTINTNINMNINMMAPAELLALQGNMTTGNALDLSRFLDTSILSGMTVTDQGMSIPQYSLTIPQQTSLQCPDLVLQQAPLQFDSLQHTVDLLQPLQQGLPSEHVMHLQSQIAMEQALLHQQSQQVLLHQQSQQQLMHQGAMLQQQVFMHQQSFQQQPNQQQQLQQTSQPDQQLGRTMFLT